MFKAKLRQIGNSQGVYIPLRELEGFTVGEEIELEIIRGEKIVPVRQEQIPLKVINEKPSTRMEMCPKHLGSRKITCGCK